MRYRYNNIYDIVKNENTNVSMTDLEKIIKDLIPSQNNDSYDFDHKFRELEKLIDENSSQLKSLNNEKEELLKLVDDRLKTVEGKLDSLANVTTGTSEQKYVQNLDVIMDELEAFEEKQKEFNNFICEKVDDRIDRINDLIEFINDIKAQVDVLDPNNAVSKDANELQKQLAHINERLTKLENNKDDEVIINVSTPAVVDEEKIVITKLDRVDIDGKEDDQEEVENIIDEINDDENEVFQEKFDELLSLLEEQKEENLKLSKELSMLGNSEEVDEATYNENWLKEFEEMQLSLEDDGIYEYDVEDIGEDMKYEYYNGDLPKTKIVKVKSNESVRNYSHDEINSFIGEEARKLASREIDKLQSDAELTQRAWLANNQRITELTSIIEKQEEEIRRLNAYSKVQDSKYLSEGDDLQSMIKMEALKLIRDEYEQRISNLENGRGISNDDKLAALQQELEAQKLENMRLKSMLENTDKKSEPVVVNVTNAIPAAPTASAVEPKRSESSIVGSQRRKRKQKFFFEIKEHNGPKITKADLDKESKTK